MNFTKKFIKSNGITLIALVVTIIVLLILAGITINMLTSDNGIIKKALEAKQKTEAAQEEESRILKEYEDLMKKYGSGSTGGNGGGENPGGEEPGDEDGKLPETAEGQPAGTPIKNPTGYGENAQATADGDGKYFAKPDGATYLEGTVDTGVVVSIKESQFVWVPVDDVVLDTSDTSKTEKLPKSSTAGTSSGYTYTPMAVKVGNDYKGILYGFSGNNGYLIYAKNQNYQGGGSSDYKEPGVVSEYDGGTSDTVTGKITIDKLTEEYNAMIESVKKYKGFYVARYEAGLDNETNEIVFKNANLSTNKCTTTGANNSETGSWYGLYKKIKTFTTSSDKVVSSMIWGSQYDAMMNWMAKNGSTVGLSNSSIHNNTTTTGGKDTDIINNVYDLYGCHYEWTLEANGSRKYRVTRGGFYSYTGNNSPGIRDKQYPDSKLERYSSRATLYIK